MSYSGSFFSSYASATLSQEEMHWSSSLSSLPPLHPPPPLFFFFSPARDKTQKKRAALLPSLFSLPHSRSTHGAQSKSREAKKKRISLLSFSLPLPGSHCVGEKREKERRERRKKEEGRRPTPGLPPLPPPKEVRRGILWKA